MKRSISHPGTYNYERYTMFTKYTDFLFSVQTAYAVIFWVAINAGTVFLQGRACQKSAWHCRSPPRGGRGHAPIQRLTATEGPRIWSVSLTYTQIRFKAWAVTEAWINYYCCGSKNDRLDHDHFTSCVFHRLDVSQSQHQRWLHSEYPRRGWNEHKVPVGNWHSGIWPFPLNHARRIMRQGIKGKHVLLCSQRLQHCIDGFDF